MLALADPSSFWPFLTLGICVAAIIVLITKLRVHPFLALVGVAILAGLLAPRGSLPGEPAKSHWVQAVEITASELGVVCGKIGIVIALASSTSITRRPPWGGLLGLQFVIVNGGANNGDSVQINALGGSLASLFNGGNIGGAGGVGLPQRLAAELTIAILGGNTASVSGSLADSLGNLWTGPSTTFNLGAAPASLFAGVNLNASAGISGITALNWTATVVPEPSTAMLLIGLGLAGLVFGRGLRPNN